MWHGGYVSEIDYTHGYYGELSPSRLRMVTALAKQRTSVGESPSYLELGFGQGHTLNIHAAANPGEYWGNDFNAGQAATARELAEATGAGAQMLDNSFEELAARPDLPEFDIIALHGIWSWISDANRAIIVDIARRRLKPGGIFYVSYNTAPGWSVAGPLRHLMKQFADRAGSGSLVGKIEQALAFADQVVEADAGYFKANPAVVQRLQKLKEQDRRYLAHEYLNHSWDVIPFSEVAEKLSEAKLNFASSAGSLDLIDSLNFREPALKLMEGIEDTVLRQTVRDYLANQQFRRDVFVKGARPLSPLEQARYAQGQRYILTCPPESVPTKVQAGLGSIELRKEIYEPVIETLAADSYRPKNVSELREDARCASLSVAQTVQAVIVLTGIGAAAPVHSREATESTANDSARFNAEICRRAEFSSDFRYLASPVTGAGINVNRVDQLFLRADRLGQKDRVNWVWPILKAEGVRFRKDDRTLESDEENIDYLRQRSKEFSAGRQQVLDRLGVSKLA